MKVSVRLFSQLAKRLSDYDAGKGIDIEVPEGATYRDVADALRLTTQEAGLFTVRGILKRPIDPVVDGDEVSIFPPIGGG